MSESPTSITLAGKDNHCNFMEGKALQDKEYTKFTQPLKNTDQTQQTMLMMQKLRNNEDVNSQDNIMPSLVTNE